MKAAPLSVAAVDFDRQGLAPLGAELGLAAPSGLLGIVIGPALTVLAAFLGILLSLALFAYSIAELP